MRQPSSRSLEILPFIVLFVLAGCASAGIALFDLEPTQGDVASVTLAEGAVAVTARYLDTGERTDYLTGMDYEPLGLSLRSVSLLTFLFSVQNRSVEPLIVDPAGMRVATGAGDLLRPYNYAHLYLELPQGSGRQKVLQDLKNVTYERTVQIEPGAAQEKLLLFKRPGVVGEEVTILVNGLYLGGRGVDGTLVFRAVDLSK
jgi:hypothetical protein